MILVHILHYILSLITPSVAVVMGYSSQLSTLNGEY